jgi:signal peptidase I
MYPTITPGDTILVRRNPYASVEEIQRGDVITAVPSRIHELGLGQGLAGVWRVVGLPGDEVRTVASEVEVSGVNTSRELHHHDREGTVYREKLGRVAYFITVGSNCTGTNAIFRVPANHIYVLGDHRCATRDSGTFGPVPFEAITGRVIWAF